VLTNVKSLQMIW